MHDDYATFECPRCQYHEPLPMWGPQGLCRDCYDNAAPSPYCSHGFYIGGPSGADYICGFCEAEA